MIDWTQFHFLRPGWLLLLAPVALLVWLLVRRRLNAGSWRSVVDPALLPHVVVGSTGARRRWPVALIAAAAAIAVLALAGPAWDRLPQPVFAARGALVIALDLSRSMDATDVNPSRVARARFKIADILDQRPDGQAGMLVYAGDAFTVAPLTDDINTIVSQLPALTPDIMPVQGSRVDRALVLARDLLRQSGFTEGDILVVTDHVDPERAADAARALRGDGYRVSVLGVGTSHGVPIPMPDGGFLKNTDGEIVIPVLEEQPLRHLAQAGGGVYRRLTVGAEDVKHLDGLFRTDPAAAGAAQTELETDVWRDRGPWLVLLLLPLAAFTFRRGYLVVLPLLLAPLPRPVHAFDWDELWSRPEQRGQAALEQGAPGAAAELFTDPRRRGAAQYLNGDYAAAAETLAAADDAASLYNRGNALARAGRYPEALAAYDRVLERDPEHEDARHNRDIVQQHLERQRQQQQSRDGEGDGGDRESTADGSRSPQQGDDEEGESGNGSGSPQPGSAAEDPPGAGGQGADAGGEPLDGDRKQARADPGDGEQQRRDASASAEPAPESAPGELDQATEHWLRRIPDDPGGLLRRKFLYQYSQRRGNRDPADQPW